MGRIKPFSLIDPSLEARNVRSQAALLCRVQERQILDAYPCTPLQAGLLALTARESGSYVAQFSFRLSEDINVKRLHDAWQRVATTNPILRTRIVNIPRHGLFQVVVDEPLLWSSDYDDTNSSSEDGLQELMGLGTALTRFSILPNYDGSFRLQWDIHHALYDGWSFPLLLQQAESAYYGLPEANVQPITILINYQLEQDEKTRRSYWMSQFADIQGGHFPISKVGGHSATTDDRIHLKLAIPQSEPQRNITAATVMKAAWSIVVAELTGKEEALFGVTVSGRQAPIADIESMIGPAIATVPIRVQLNWGWSVTDLLRSVQCQATDMIPFEQTGLQKIRQYSQEAALACNFQTLMVIQPTKQDDSPSTSIFEDAAGSSLDDSDNKAFQTYPIVIEIHLAPTEAHVQFDFDSSKITRKDVVAVAAAFDRVSRALFERSQSNAKLRSIAIQAQNPTDIERMWTWNAIVPEASEKCLHDLIEAHITARPTSLAICAWNGELTYGELGALSTRLAKQIIQMGVRGAVIPLLLEKSMWMPVATLAVLKAGATPVAVDISQPKQRLSTIVSQATTSMVICSTHARDLAREVAQPGGQIVIVEDLAKTASGDVPVPDVRPDSGLYVVFTSGSTGTPKGAMVSHRNFASAILHQRGFLGFSERSRVLDFASYAFDVAWSNLYNTLTSGGCLCIPSAHERENDLTGCLERYQINVLDLTPAIARTLDRELLSGLSTLILGGEAAQAQDAFLAGPNTKVFNLYGPAECTPTITLTQLKGDNANIGRGAGVCTWIVNPERPDELSPLGAVGELWVEGPLVGEGYLNNPTQTASAFIEDPAWLVAGVPSRHGRPEIPGRRGRLYRTGDLVSYNEDGTLNYAGRRDAQIKIRGQRVELGEIEQTIRQALTLFDDAQSSKPQVLVETIRPEGASSLSIVAFIQFIGEGTLHTEETHKEVVQRMAPQLTDHVSNILPTYMVPSLFVPMFKFPVTTNGKIDRRALRTQAESQWREDRETPSTSALDGALNETERVLQQVWMSVLNLPQDGVSINKPFMRMGGDSITAMQIVAECRLRSITTTVGQILQSSTIKKLATCCQSTIALATDAQVDDLEDSATVRFQLSPIQRNFFDSFPDGLNHYNQSFILDMKDGIEPKSLQGALQALVSRHPMLRARFLKDENGVWCQELAADESHAFTYAEHFVSSYAGFGRATQWRQENLDIERGPVFAGDLFHVPGQGIKLVLSAHHLVIDLVSWRIVWQEIEDWIEHGHLQLPPTASFSRWVRSQARVASTASPLAVLPYTLNKPQPEFWGLELDANTYGGVESYDKTFDQAFTESLFGAANDAFHTEPIDIILGSLAKSFAQVFVDRASPAFWLEGHGREQLDAELVDVSQTIGWFTTLLPLAITLSGQDSLTHAVRLTKDLRQSVPGKGQPYFACRYHSESGREAFQDHGEVVEVQVNFTGRFQQLEKDDGLFKPAGLDEDEVQADSDFDLAPVSLAAKRSAFIDITAGVQGDTLNVSFEVHNKMKHQERLREWTEAFVDTLKSSVYALLNATPAPTLADLPFLPLSYESLDTLVHEQLASLGISADEIMDIYPCAPMQEGMLLSQAKGSASYATQSIWSCAPVKERTITISPSKLEAAWRAVAARHSIMSSIFQPHPDGQGFLQVVLSTPEFQVKTLEARHDDPADVLSKFTPPEFGLGLPGHCFTICHSLDGRVACRLDIDHAYYDAASADLLVEELTAMYDDCKLPDAPAFRHVVEHISKIEKSQRTSQWAEILKGIEPCEFPTSSNLLSEFSSQDHSDISVLGAQGKAILAFCKRAEITHSVFFQVVWAMVLSRYTGMHGVCFGSLSSGRDIAVQDIDKIVGPVAVMSICHVDLDEPLRDVLKSTMNRSSRRFEIQHTSLADIQRSLGLSGHKLCNTSLSIQHSQPEVKRNRSIELVHRDGADMHEDDLTFNVRIGADNIDAGIAFRQFSVSQHLAKETADALTQAVSYLLSNFEQSAAAPLSQSFFKHMVGVEEERAITFWKSQFSGTEGTHFPPRKDSTPCAASHSFVASTFQHLVPKHTDYPISVVIRAAWAILVSRNLNSEESLFGISSQEDQHLVPVRVKLDSNATITEFLEQIQAQATELRPCQKTGLERIRRTSDDAAVAGDFQTLLREFSESQRPLTRNYGPSGTQHNDPALPMILDFQAQADDTTAVRIKFDPKSIEEAKVSQILSQLATITGQLVNVEERRMKLNEISVISRHDLQQVWSWNETLPQVVNECIHDLIARHAHSHPGALAIYAWDGSFTYSELDKLSTILASELVAKGVAIGDVVPICFEKSKWTTVTALSVMKAGGVCLLIDPSTQPEDRIRSMATQAKSSFVLASPTFKPLADSLGLGEVMEIDSESVFKLSLAAQKTTLPTVKPSDILYVMFTSGSTGQPKGIMISHSNYSSSVAAQCDELGFNRTSRVLDFASYAFDAAWWNMLNTLTSGGCLCVPSAKERDNIPECFERYDISNVDLIPSVARHIEPQSAFSRLSHLYLAGEPVLPSDGDLPGSNTTVWNVYGPAECTPLSTFQNMAQTQNGGIGRGAGICTWVVEPENPKNLAAIGSIGELWLEGPTVGMGYINQPEKTAATFVKDPEWLLSGVPGLQPGRRGIVYRTGDLVRYDSDGTLIFVGRQDSQVKVRGQRLELGEVEHHVTHAVKATNSAIGVQVAAEVATLKGAEKKSLVAFVVLESQDFTGMHNDEYAKFVRDATAHTSERLETSIPPYMVPIAYIPIRAMPRTPSGKVDRRQLRAQASTFTRGDLAMMSGEGGKKQQQPSTESELVLQSLWAEVLSLEAETIGIYDSFLRLGGDSIGAMQLVMKARKRGFVLTVKEIFQRHVLVDLAALMCSRATAA